MADLPASALVARFGAEGARIHARAHGEETIRSVRATPPNASPSPSRSNRRWRTSSRSGSCSIGWSLALATQTAARGLAVTHATLRLDLDLAFAPAGTSGELVAAQRFPEPTSDAEAIERLLFARLERTPPPAAVARLSLELAGAEPAAGQQLPLFVPQAARNARLAWQLARLALDVRRGSHPPDGARRPGSATPRTALDVAPGGPGMTRLLREHPLIDVELDAAGALTAIRWNGRREPVEVCNRWRIDEAWWRQPIARDYVKVVGERWLALVYLDRIDGTWHLERLYD